MSTLQRDRWFGSLRISQGNRLGGFSPWTFPGLPHISFWVRRETVAVMRGGRRVMFLYLDDEGERVESACFLYDLTPQQLADAVADLRRVKGGLERWIVPALEWNSVSSAVRDEHPETFKVIPGLLRKCRDLPVAKSWQKVRADHFADAARRARAASKTAPDETAEAVTPARKRREKATGPRKPRGRRGSPR